MLATLEKWPLPSTLESPACIHVRCVQLHADNPQQPNTSTNGQSRTRTKHSRERRRSRQQQRRRPLRTRRSIPLFLHGRPRGTGGRLPRCACSLPSAGCCRRRRCPWRLPCRGAHPSRRFECCCLGRRCHRCNRSYNCSLVVARPSCTCTRSCCGGATGGRSLRGCASSRLSGRGVSPRGHCRCRSGERRHILASGYEPCPSREHHPRRGHRHASLRRCGRRSGERCASQHHGGLAAGPRDKAREGS